MIPGPSFDSARSLAPLTTCTNSNRLRAEIGRQLRIWKDAHLRQ